MIPKSVERIGQTAVESQSLVTVITKADELVYLTDTLSDLFAFGPRITVGCFHGSDPLIHVCSDRLCFLILKVTSNRSFHTLLRWS